MNDIGNNYTIIFSYAIISKLLSLIDKIRSHVFTRFKRYKV